MSNEAQSTIIKFEQTVKATRKIRNLNCLIASTWTLAALIMWLSFVTMPPYTLAGAVAFTGVSFMYWMLAKGASDKYDLAVEEWSRHPK